MDDGVVFTVDPMRANPYLGSPIEPDALERLVRFGSFAKLTRTTTETVARTAALLAAGKIVAWVQGRAEFGPRALGNRSILRIHDRSTFRTASIISSSFASLFDRLRASILDEAGGSYFDNYCTTRYMERTLRFRTEVRDCVAGVVHVDGTGRLQSVRRDWNPRFYDLLTEFHARSGIPLLLNTSLNVMGKPIVHSLEDCLGVFFTTGIDVLVVDDVLIEK